jgi:hypothetical protein
MPGVAMRREALIALGIAGITPYGPFDEHRKSGFLRPIRLLWGLFILG